MPNNLNIMNLRKTIYNALNLRGLQKSPPPQFVETM